MNHAGNGRRLVVQAAGRVGDAGAAGGVAHGAGGGAGVAPAEGSGRGGLVVVAVGRGAGLVGGVEGRVVGGGRRIGGIPDRVEVADVGDRVAAVGAVAGAADAVGIVVAVLAHVLLLGVRPGTGTVTDRCRQIGHMLAVAARPVRICGPGGIVGSGTVAMTAVAACVDGVAKNGLQGPAGGGEGVLVKSPVCAVVGGVTGAAAGEAGSVSSEAGAVAVHGNHTVTVVAGAAPVVGADRECISARSLKGMTVLALVGGAGAVSGLGIDVSPVSYTGVPASYPVAVAAGAFTSVGEIGILVPLAAPGAAVAVTGAGGTGGRRTGGVADAGVEGVRRIKDAIVMSC